jgi:hypothetical protein
MQMVVLGTRNISDLYFIEYSTPAVQICSGGSFTSVNC